jgi:hypothetical protein
MMLEGAVMKFELSDTPIRQASYRGTPSRQTSSTKRFVAWDTEGVTIDGVHRTVLVGNSDGAELSNPEGLSGLQLARFMLRNADKAAIHIIFAGSYDAVMMVKGFSENQRRRFCTSQVVKVRDVRFDFRKSKSLRMGDAYSSMVLYDVFTFFQCSFVKACQQFILGECVGDVWERIVAGKQMRSTFTIEQLPEITRYFRGELELLVKLATELRSRFHAANIYPSMWHGPGAVASYILKSHGMKAHLKRPTEELESAATQAYYGGRFEQFKIGVHGKAHGYDIRSAYPSHMRDLPSLSHGSWVASTELAPFGLYRVDCASSGLLGLLPWRAHDGSIFYPHAVRSSWYWGVELLAAQPHADYLHIHEGYQFVEHERLRPMQFVQGMYDERARRKAVGDGSQLALKLGLNSLYGKFAQSVGAKHDELGGWALPPWHQIEYAGYITAATRAQILSAAMQSPDHVIAIETDGIYTTKPLKLPESEKLGDWEHEAYDGIMYVQSGVYYKCLKGVWSLRTRGFEARSQDHDTWVEVMERLPAENVTMTHHHTRFVTDWRSEQFGEWVPMERSIAFNSITSKRVHIADKCSACKKGRKFSEGLHEMQVPEGALTHHVEPSKGYRMPWLPVDTAIQRQWDAWIIVEGERLVVE